MFKLLVLTFSKVLLSNFAWDMFSSKTNPTFQITQD